MFINDSKIDATCLNKSKLHLNRKDASYLANDFGKYISYAKRHIHDSINGDGTLEGLTTSPKFMTTYHNFQKVLRSNLPKSSNKYIYLLEF